MEQGQCSCLLNCPLPKAVPLGVEVLGPRQVTCPAQALGGPCGQSPGGLFLPDWSFYEHMRWSSHPSQWAPACRRRLFQVRLNTASGEDSDAGPELGALRQLGESAECRSRGPVPFLGAPPTRSWTHAVSGLQLSVLLDPSPLGQTAPAIRRRTSGC